MDEFWDVFDATSLDPICVLLADPEIYSLMLIKFLNFRLKALVNMEQEALS